MVSLFSCRGRAGRLMFISNRRLYLYIYISYIITVPTAAAAAAVTAAVV